MAEAAKDTIYVDVDDEITAVIDKVKNSPKEIVALVLPKRASMLQSIVNMKLLKKTATKAKKRVVLITSEASLLALSGIVGLHVAKSLQSKPAIPPIPETADLTDEISADQLSDKPINPAATVGELAVTSGAEVETIEVDNSATPDGAPVVATQATKAEKAAKKGEQKFKIPNFDLFRKRLFLIIAGVILLIGGWYWAFIVAPHATVTIKTEAKDVSSVVEFTADTEAKELNQDSKVIPATQKVLKKTETEKVPATGQKDVGDKASGTLTLKNCATADGTVTIPAGTGASSGSFTFITKEAVVLPASVFSGGGTCLTPTKDVGVTAQSGGDSYNLSARSYTVANFPSVSASGTAMSGGTSRIVKIVSGSDVDNAKQKLSAKTSTAADEIKKSLDDEGLFGLVDTLNTGTPAYKATPNVGDEATEVSVTSDTIYTMLGIKTQDLRKLLEVEVGKQVDLKNQPITEDGLDKGQYRIIDKQSEKHIRMSVQVSSHVGVQFDTDALKNEIRGKERGQIQQIIQNKPGVKEVDVRYNPFWIFSTPKAAKKINIIIEPVTPSGQ